MASNYGQYFGGNTDTTAQTVPVFGKNQVENSAGGFVFEINDWKRLDRFLVLGCEGGSYYASEQKLTVENAESILRLLVSDGSKVVERILEVSLAGRAPKNDPALFALALAVGKGDDKTRSLALEALPQVARIGTHLFTFLEYVQAFRGWGRGLRKGIANWYTSKTPDTLAYQLSKYRQRNGWSHKDALRLSHPVAPSEAHNALFKFVTKDVLTDDLPSQILDFAILQKATSVGEAIEVLSGNKSLTWEMVPTEFLGSPEVWEALLPNMLPTAILRNLGRMTANGLLAPLNEGTYLATGKLTDVNALRKAKVHPLSVLVALKTYEQGHGEKGKLSWSPIQTITDALNEAFYLSFGAIEPTGKRTLLALDVSGSMSSGQVAGMTGITPRIGSAAMSLVTAAVEKHHHIMGFTHGLVPLKISPKQRLDQVVKTISNLNFGGTDCSLPMVWAKTNKVPVDTFVVYTDNETWAGAVHPFQALKQYRQAMGIPAKLVVVGMTATEFSIADPSDAGMLDVVGFDTAAPNVISDFARE